MIDTIHIRLNLEEDLNNDQYYITRLLQVATIEKEVIKHSQGIKCLVGKFENFIIEINDNNISIMGSLTKFYKGNNLDFLDKSEIQQAIKLLSKRLGIPVEKGRLSRIDVSDNLFLTKKPIVYIDSLISIPRAYITSYRTSKSFRRSCMTCMFYDKLEEIEKNQPYVHSIFRRDHPEIEVLRYEVKLLNKLNTVLKVRKVKVVMLYSSSFLNKLGSIWIKQYSSVTKEKQDRCLNIQNLLQFKKQLMYEGLKALGGANRVLKQIDNIRIANDWNAAKTKRAKDEVKKLSNDEFLVKDLSLMKELDDAVMNSNIQKLLNSLSF